MVALEALLLFLSACLIPVIVAIIGSWLQNRSWRRQSVQQSREQQRAEATKLVDEITLDISKRLYAQKRVCWSLMRGEKDDEAIGLYRECLWAWNSDYHRRLARLEVLFDEEVALDLDKEISARLVVLNQQIEAALRLSANPADLRKTSNSLDRLGRTAFLFSRRLYQRLVREQFGYTQPVDVYGISKMDDLSHIYLVKRLFGIAK